MSYNSINAERIYNRYCKKYEKRTNNYSKKFLALDIDLFLKSLPGKNILDLGCGPGRDSQIFKNKGFHPLCLDISEGMLDLCRKKSLKTIKMNFENLKLNDKFDGIWSYTSLTTISKELAKTVIQKVRLMLNDNGIFYLGVIEGNFEGWKKPDKKYNLPRYVSRYSFNEILNMCKNFELVYFRKITKEQSERNTYLNFMFKKSRAL
ncbi:MAG: class I SAM-dependent methyltransferase [Candidatus Pacearchaeota archaeon]|nr:class I SAM-dependent methyltransferase [Candidatus Pacearchaeota archaeon]